MHAHVRLTHLLQEHHSINFMEEDLRHKLSNISEKLYTYQAPFKGLTSEEQKLWHSFDIGDITFFSLANENTLPIILSIC